MNICVRCPHMTQNIFVCGEDQVLSMSYRNAFESAFGKLREENQRLKDDILLMKNEKSSKLSSLISDIDEMYERLESHTTYIENELNDKATEICSMKVGSDEEHVPVSFLISIEAQLRDLYSLVKVDSAGKSKSPSRIDVINELLDGLSSILKDLIAGRDEDNKAIRDLSAKVEEVKQKNLELAGMLEDEIGSKRALQRRCSEIELCLTQSRDLVTRLEHKYDNSKADLADCHHLAAELKEIIIEKNRDIQSKEGVIMELQYQLDDLSARLDHDKSPGIDPSPSKPANDEWLANMEKQESLLAEIERLEREILKKELEQSQQESMHQSIVDGLESRCDMFSEEIEEAREYIGNLEDMKENLEESIDTMKRESTEYERKCQDLATACALLKHQKESLERKNESLSFGVKDITGQVLKYSSRLEYFCISSKPDLESIAHFIRHIIEMNEKYASDIQIAAEELKVVKSQYYPVSAEATTPKAKNGCNSSTLMKLVGSQRDDMLNSLENTKNAIKQVMSSPRFTPVKVNQGQCTDFEDSLYKDLVFAVEQLELFSDKVRVLEEDQACWNLKETSLNTRISELEQEVNAPATDGAGRESAREIKMKEIGANLLSNFFDRRRKDELRRAFLSWSTQAKLARHLDLAKEMSKELINTRKKVLLLKYHFDNS